MSYYDDASLMLLAGGGAEKDGKVYSVKPTDGSGDFTFSRGSNLSATRVNASYLIEKGRENLALYSNKFNESYWQKLSGCSIVGQTATDPFGVTNNAWLVAFDGTTNARIERFISGSAIKTMSVYVRTQSGTQDVLIGFGGSDPLITKTITTTWQRVETFTPTGGSYSRLRCDDAVTLEVFGYQVEQGLAATEYIPTTTTTGTAGILENTPRFDYSNGASCPSFLLEPSRLNNILYSENVTTTWWLKSNVTALDNQGISPEGLNNAGKITLTSTGAAVLYKTSLTIGNGVLSFFAKPGTLSGGRVRISVDGVGAADWNLDGTINSVSGGTAEGAENYGNGWFRYSYNVPSGSVANYGVQGGVIGESMLVYGMQVEPNATYPTSYIPTYGTSQTRAGEVCGGAGDANTFNSTEGVLYAEAKTFSITGSAGIISLSNGTTSNRVTIELDGANIKVRFVVGGSSIGIFNYAINIKETLKIAAKYKANDFALWVNGTERVAITSGSSFSNNTLSELSFDRGDGNEIFLGNVKQVITFNTALTDTELATLTTL